MGTDKFCLRWNDFEGNISSALKELRDENEFFDVTIACDNEQIKAHKVILSACSPFFRNILRRNPHNHPLLYLKGVKFTDLEAVLNFMYHGEVNVAQEDLNSFLAVAEDLRVKGLTQTQTEKEKGGRKEQNNGNTVTAEEGLANDAKQVSKAKHFMNPLVEEEEIQEVIPIKLEPKDATNIKFKDSPARPTPQPIIEHSIATYQEPDMASYQTKDVFTNQEQAMTIYQEEYEQYEEEQHYETDHNMEMQAGAQGKGNIKYIYCLITVRNNKDITIKVLETEIAKTIKSWF